MLFYLKFNPFIKTDCLVSVKEVNRAILSIAIVANSPNINTHSNTIQTESTRDVFGDILPIFCYTCSHCRYICSTANENPSSRL